jgi:hypothetical protein
VGGTAAVDGGVTDGPVPSDGAPVDATLDAPLVDGGFAGAGAAGATVGPGGIGGEGSKGVGGRGGGNGGSPGAGGGSGGPGGGSGSGGPGSGGRGGGGPAGASSGGAGGNIVQALGMLSNVQRSAGAGPDQGLGVAVTTSGDVVVGGRFLGSDTFDPTGTPRSVSSHAGMAKEAPGCSSWEHGLVALPDGGVAVGGFFEASGTTHVAVFGPGEPGSVTLLPLPGYLAQIMVAWFRADGTARGARIVAHGYSLSLFNMAARNDGGLILTGGFSRETTFGPLDPTPVMFTGPAVPSSGVVPEDMFVGSFLP